MSLALIDYLKERKIDVPEGWTLIDARYVSHDGSLIIGSARDEKKRVRPFRVEMPVVKVEPIEFEVQK